MQDKRKLAIEVDNVQKIYKLYDKPSDRLKRPNIRSTIP